MQTIKILSLALFLVGCTAAENTPDPADMGSDSTPDSDMAEANVPLTWDVDAPGPYNVGYQQVQATYSPKGEDRTIDISIWYPTEDTNGENPRYLGLFRDPVAMMGTELAPSPYADGKYPIMVYSHGDRGFSGTASRMMHYFVSHGWVVAAPDHLLNTATDTPDPRPKSLRYLRTLDLTATLDRLAELNADGEFADTLDTSRVIMSGHSFGSYTVWPTAGATFDTDGVAEQCDLDTAMPTCDDEDIEYFTDGVREDRVIAAYAMAGPYNPSWFGETGFESVQIPIFSITGSEDQRGQAEEWARMQNSELEFTWVDVEDACHEAFALGSCSNITNDDADAIVHTYGLAYARYHLLGDSSVVDVLSGERELDTRATLQTTAEY